MFSRDPPLSTHLGIGHDEHDQEGRVVTAEFDRFFVVSVYTPNSGAARCFIFLVRKYMPLTMISKPVNACKTIVQLTLIR